MKRFAGREDSEVCLGPHPQDPEGRQAQGAQDLWPFTESKVPGKAKNLFTEMFLSIVVSKFKEQERLIETNLTWIMAKHTKVWKVSI